MFYARIVQMSLLVSVVLLAGVTFQHGRTAFASFREVSVDDPNILILLKSICSRC